MINFRALLAVSLIALPYTTPALALCLSYTKPVVVAGVLERATFPGPPNFESIPAGDEPEAGFYLKLKKPICVAGSIGSSVNEPAQNASLVQLILKQPGYDLFRPAIGRAIQVRGTLMSAFDGNHHAPLLLRHPVMVRPSSKRR